MTLLIKICICLLFSLYVYSFFITKQLDAQHREFDDIIDADLFD